MSFLGVFENLWGFFGYQNKILNSKNNSLYKQQKITRYFFGGSENLLYHFSGLKFEACHSLG